MDKKMTKEKEVNISFDVFWNLYEKRVGDKTKLEKKWLTLTDQDRQQIIDYIPKYKQSQPDKQYRKNPETFLNNKSWNDEIIITVKENQSKKINNEIAADNLMRRIREDK